MKDIKITEQNYKELFECAGFEWMDHGKTNAIKYLDVQGGYGCSLYLSVKYSESTFVVDLGVSLGGAVRCLKKTNSTAEIDRIFYPFLDKPLVWEKKWDFESVFERRLEGTSMALQHKTLKTLYEHPNPRVQAFSRLLFVMNELNKEYKVNTNFGSEIYLGEGASLSIDTGVSREDMVGCWVFKSSIAANLFLRDNEADLKTFFNI